jgi:hypothetical protein
MISKNAFVTQMNLIKMYDQTLGSIQSVMGINFNEGPLLDMVTGLTHTLVEDTGNLPWEDGAPLVEHFLFSEDMTEEGFFVTPREIPLTDGSVHVVSDFFTLWDFLHYLQCLTIYQIPVGTSEDMGGMEPDGLNEEVVEVVDDENN